MIMILLQAKKHGNTLYYNLSKGEYTYLHKGHKIWSEKADSGLYDYIRKLSTPLDIDELKKFPVYIKYEVACTNKEGERK